MIIKNISSKIINVGSTVLLPDKTMTAHKNMRNNPALSIFAEKGHIIFIEEEKDKEVAKPAPKNKPETPKPADSASTAKDSENAGAEPQK